MASYEFRPAVRERTSLLLALAGPTGCGKTYSALRLAQGLKNGGNVAVIDTEAGRALHYADQFAFDHCELRAPFRPETYREAIVAAENAGYSVIIVDSMSHEYDGEGGIVEWADEIIATNPKIKPPAQWKEPKLAHKRLVSRLLQCRAHLIFCLRAEEKMLMRAETDGRGHKRTIVIPAQDRPLMERWQPLCEKRFMYEMTASFLMLSDRPGVPLPLKLQEQHHHAFPDGQTINEDTGLALSKWAHGAKAERREDPYEEAIAAAERGVEAFREWWKAQPATTRAVLKGRTAELKAIAEDADNGPDTSDDPWEEDSHAETDAHEDPPAEAEADAAVVEDQEDMLGGGGDALGEPPAIHVPQNATKTEWLAWLDSMHKAVMASPDEDWLDVLIAKNKRALDVHAARYEADADALGQAIRRKREEI